MNIDLRLEGKIVRYSTDRQRLICLNSIRENTIEARREPTETYQGASADVDR